MLSANAFNFVQSKSLLIGRVIQMTKVGSGPNQKHLLTINKM